MRVFLPVALLFGGLFLVSCELFQTVLPYDPPVVFTGTFDDEFGTPDVVELRGHHEARNTCTLVRDTIRMYFYSENYEPGGSTSQWRGDQLRVDIYPFNQDSFDLIGTRHLLVDLNRYPNRPGERVRSYLLVSSDTNVARTAFESRIMINDLNRRRGGKIDLDIVYLPMHYVGRTSPALSIINGTIEGRIQ